MSRSRLNVKSRSRSIFNIFRVGVGSRLSTPTSTPRSRPSLEKVHLLILWSSRLRKNTKIHLFSKPEKFRKDKLCLFCKSTVWWKTSPKTSFERVWDFESSGALKDLKIQTLIKDIFWQNRYFWKQWTSKSEKEQTLLVCKPFASWKTTQKHLLTKVMTFESSEVSKISKKNKV